MTTLMKICKSVSYGKPDAGNPHVAPTLRYDGTGQFDEGDVAFCTEKALHGSLLYKLIPISVIMAALGALLGIEFPSCWIGRPYTEAFE